MYPSLDMDIHMKMDMDECNAPTFTDLLPELFATANIVPTDG